MIMKRSGSGPSSSKEIWTIGSPDSGKKRKESDDEPPVESSPEEVPTTSSKLPKAGPKSWKRKVAKAREEKSFAHVDDLLMSDSEDDTEDNSKSATDNLNETEGVTNTDQDEVTDYSDDEFEVDDLGSSNLIQQFRGSKDRSECSTCGQVLPTPRLAQHQELPHPLACPEPDCDKKFVLAKTLERHQRKAHVPRQPTPTLLSTQLSNGGHSPPRKKDVEDGHLPSKENSEQTHDTGGHSPPNDISEQTGGHSPPTTEIGSQSPKENSEQSTDSHSPPKEASEKTFDVQSSIKSTALDQEETKSSEDMPLQQPMGSCDLIREDGNNVGHSVDKKDNHQEVGEEISIAASDAYNAICKDSVHMPSDESPISDAALNNEMSNSKNELDIEVNPEGAGSHEIKEHKGPFICQFCHEEFKSWAILTRHFITPHLFKCEFCSLVFNRDSSLEDHTNSLHDLTGLINSTSCGLCGESFSRSSTLARHSSAPHNFPCKKCDKRYQLKKLLTKHNPVCPNKHLIIQEDEPKKKPRKRGRKAANNGVKARRVRKSLSEERHSSDEESEDDEDEESNLLTASAAKRGKKAVNLRKSLSEEKHSSDEESEDEESDDDDDEKSNLSTATYTSVRKRSRKAAKNGVKARRARKSLSEERHSSDEESESDDDVGSKKPNAIVKNESSDEDKINLSHRLKRVKQDITEEISGDENDNVKMEDDTTIEKIKIAIPKRKSSEIEHICDLCGQTIKGIKGLKVHTARDHKFSCELCPKRFLVRTKLIAHKAEYHKSEVFQFECELCMFKVVSETKISLTLAKNKVKKHQEMDHNFGCDLCLMKFVSADRLDYHKSQTHDADFVTDYKCKLCNTDFGVREEKKRIKDFLDHNETVHKFVCDYCELKFTTSVALKRHFEETHENQRHCMKCKIEFTKEDLLSHVKTPHPFDCQECEFHFVSEERLMYHMMTIHEQEQEIVTNCKKCGKHVGELEEFLNHIELDHGEFCEHCSKTFINTGSLEEHNQQEHPPQQFVCTHCEEIYEEDEKDEYEDHIALEHKESCPYCVKKFVRRGAMVKHILAQHEHVKFCCKYCGKDFEKAFDDYRRHESESHDKICRFCVKSFVKTSYLLNHLEEDHRDKDFLCTRCGQNFKQAFKECLKHEDIPHEFKCENCDKKFSEKSIHDKHSLEVHGVSVGLDLRCGQCQASFSNTTSFREHFKVPHKSFCSKCDLKFPDKVSLDQHFSKVHQTPIKAPRLVCNLCEKRYEAREKKDYEEHCSTNHKYKCDSCEKRFIKSGRLRDHIDENHGHSKSIDDKYTCKLCRTVCNKRNDMKLSKESYKNHISLPHKFPCRKCEMRFTNKGKLDIHMETHREKKDNVSANECPICGSRFSDLEKLRDHKREPHNNACKDPKCRKKFVTENSLEKHLHRKHPEFASVKLQGGEVMFRCKFCSRSFDTGPSVQSHQQENHSNSCHLCEARFIDRDGLSSHLKHKHKVNKIPMEGFSCELCKYETMRMVEVRKHSSLSHGYHCGLCVLKFTNRNQLEVHMDSCHKGEVVPDSTEEENTASPEFVTRLGVSVLFWAGSNDVRDYLHKLMGGQVSSTRHSLFLNKQEREECCRTQDSNLYQMSCPRFLNLPTSADQALLETTTLTYRSGPPVLFGISYDKITFEYVSCVLVPETWLFYLQTVKGLTKGEAERMFKRKSKSLKEILSCWKEFDQLLSGWKVKGEKQVEQPKKADREKAKVQGKVVEGNMKVSRIKDVEGNINTNKDSTETGGELNSSTAEIANEVKEVEVDQEDLDMAENLDSIVEFLEGKV